MSLSEVGYEVPGTRLAAWGERSGARLVAFRTLPDPRPISPAALAEEWAYRYLNSPNYRLVGRGVAATANSEVARVDLVEMPPGGVDDEAGLHRTFLGLPTRGGTYWLLWVYPEKQSAVVSQTITTFLKSWRSPAELETT
jgi:hypothetical protein